MRLEINKKLNMSVCFPETEISNTPEQGVRLSADLYLLIWLDN